MIDSKPNTSKSEPSKNKKPNANWNKIFVNRSLNMESIKAIGFDMDHTLAIYNSNSFEALAFEETLKKFIENGYPTELKKLKFDPDFLIRGLLVDRERGNLLKVDGHKYVKTAYHGHKKLTRDERRKLYNQASYVAEEFLSVDTLFSLSEVQLFIEIVDFMDQNPGLIEKSYSEVYADLRIFIDTAHRDGSIKYKVVENLEKYIIRDKYLASTLIKLIDDGKKIFLLTNSHWEYTKEIMTYLLDDAHPEFPHWRDYFEEIIVGAAKPSFFSGRQPFFEVETVSGLLRPNPESFIKGHVYHGGNADLFQKMTGLSGDEILYVGDHIFGDIMKSKGTLNWRTMLVVEELERELPKLEALKPKLQEIYSALTTLEEVEAELSKLKSKLRHNNRNIHKASTNGDEKKAHYIQVESEKIMESIQTTEEKFKGQETLLKTLIKEREAAVHPVWGELMKVGLERSRFANQVSTFACIYTSRVSNLRYYSASKKYMSYYEILPHDAQ